MKTGENQFLLLRNAPLPAAASPPPPPQINLFMQLCRLET